MPRWAPPIVTTFSLLEACKGGAKAELTPVPTASASVAPAAPVARSAASATPTASVSAGPRRRPHSTIAKRVAVERLVKAGRGVELNPKVASGPYAGRTILASGERCLAGPEEFDVDREDVVDSPPSGRRVRKTRGRTARGGKCASDREVEVTRRETP
jgi:hypothetical protein